MPNARSFRNLGDVSPERALPGASVPPAADSIVPPSLEPPSVREGTTDARPG